MATIKQEKALDKIVENHGNVSRAMLEVGYEPNTAKNPKNLTESKGFKELLENYGLTEELVTTALVEDIKGKPRKRFLELSLGAEILGMKKKSEEKNAVNIAIVLPSVALDRHDRDTHKITRTDS